MKMKKYERALYDLDKDEIDKLKAIKSVADIKSAEIVDTWRDDQLPCVGVKINGVEFGFWWIDDKLIGAFEYCSDSAKAKQVILKHLHDEIENHEV